MPSLRYFVGVLAACLMSTPGFSQVFDAASIKPAEVGARFYPRLQLDPVRLSTPAAPLRYLIAQAYGVEDYQLAGSKEWMESELYSITASTSNPADSAQMMAMLRNLLADRFQLKTHPATRQTDVFELVVPNGGSKLQPLRDGEASTPPPGMSGGDRMTISAGATIPEFVRFLNSRKGALALSRAVVDRTGLDGRFKIWLFFDNESDPDGHSGKVSIDYLSAVPRQLGLRLQPARVDCSYVVVDSAEKPLAR